MYCWCYSLPRSCSNQGNNSAVTNADRAMASPEKAPISRLS